MSTLAQRSFAKGEISPELYPRTDQAAYQIGLRTLLNSFVGKTGGTQNRPGSQFIAEVNDSSKKTRVVKFKFSKTQSYALEFGNLYMRVTIDGANVVEIAKAITGATQASPCVLTIPSHGYSDGEEIAVAGVSGMTQLNGRNFKITSLSADTLSLQNMDGSNLDATGFDAYTSDGTASRVYEIETPYSSDDLFELQFSRSLDVITIAHRDYELRELTRLSNSNWTLSTVSLSPTIETPEGVAVTGTTGSDTFWVVTAIDSETREESLQSSAVGGDSDGSSGSPRQISWTAVPGAVEYNVYKQLNGIYGFIGAAGGTTFSDDGITPDTSETPPVQRSLALDFGFIFEKISDPADLPAGDGKAVAFSHSGDFLAVAHNTTPFLTIYSVSDGVFTKLSDPSSLPSDAATDVAWSPDDEFLAITINTTPFVEIYQRSGSTFTKLSSPAALPTGQGFAVAWSPDGNYLAVAHASSPFITTYERSGTTFTKLADPVDLPPGTGRGVSLMEQSAVIFMAVAHTGGNLFTFYNLFFGVGSPTWLKIAGTPAVTGTVANGVAFSPDTEYLAVCGQGGDRLNIFHVNGTLLTAIVDPTTLPDDTATEVSWSSDSTLLTVTYVGTPFVITYQRIGSGTAAIFVPLTDPLTLPPNDAWEAAYSPDGSYLAIAHVDSPFVTLYDIKLNNPAVVSSFQQRRILANTRTSPEDVWASRTGKYKNFTIHSPLQDDDSLRFTVTGEELQEIRHILDLKRFVVMTIAGEHVGDGGEAGILTPTQINLKEHTTHGASQLVPIKIGGSALFVQERGSILRDLGFSHEDGGLIGNDLTAYSHHLVEGKTIVDWAYQKTPNSIVWMVRSDGVLLGLTYDREYQVYAWHRHEFSNGGLAESVCAVSEGTQEVLYVIVKRTIGGATKRYKERIGARFFSDIKDAAFMDSHLTYDGRNTDTSHTMALSGGTTWEYDETLTLTSSEDFFESGDVGNQIQLYDENDAVIRFTIEAYSSATEVTGKPHKLVPQSLRATAVSNWVKAVDTVGGLWHLEGQNVAVFADGFVVASPYNPDYPVLTVTNGKITLAQPFGVIHVGESYLCDIETLDIDTAGVNSLASKKKRVASVNLHLHRSRGIFVGAKPPSDDEEDALEGLTELKERFEEGYEKPVDLKTDIATVVIESHWNTNGRVFIRQVDPLPVAITAIIPDVVISTPPARRERA